MKILILVYCVWTSSLIMTSELEEKSCRGPNDVSGICKDLNDCDKLANQAGNESFTEFLQLSNLACEMPMPIICCPDENSSTEKFSEVQSQPKPTVKSKFPQVINRLPTIEDNCGVIEGVFSRIVGGEPAELGEFPWMALLGYAKRNGTILFKCDGSIITSKHILTAAHCIKDNLKIVRLGELDISTDDETKHIDFEIEGVVNHEYDDVYGYGDIAIIYLTQLIEFTPLIRPICLPILEEVKTKDYIGYHPFVAGWGKTTQKGNNSEILLKVQVEIYEGAVCRDASNGRLIATKKVQDTTICAGWLPGGKDSCQGDSGGPLMIANAINKQFRLFQIGIVSHGLGCARPGQPAVYTNVISFIDWIRKHVEKTT